MKDENEITISWKTCIKVAITVAVMYLLFRYWGSIEGFLGLLCGGLLAIFIGLIVAYVVNIPLRFFEEKLPGEKGDGTRNRTISLILTAVCMIAVVLLVCVLVLPQLVQATITLGSQVPALLESLSQNEFVIKYVPPEMLQQAESLDWGKMLSEAGGWLQTGLMSSLPQITSFFGFIGACGMGVVLAFWFLFEKDGFSAAVHDLIRTYISVGADEKFSSSIELADSCFSGYFARQFIEGVIYGTLIAIPCAIFGIPNALMLGTLVGFMSLIPMVGALIGGILGAIIVLASSWQQALIFLIIFFVVQQIEANFIYPRVVGQYLGLHGLWPLIGITLGVSLFGFAGAFIGVPITATIFRFVEADMERRKEDENDDQTPLQKLQKSLSD